eukprot:365475-Chlamydomonas_euryale.AAC.4
MGDQYGAELVQTPGGSGDLPTLSLFDCTKPPHPAHTAPNTTQTTHCARSFFSTLFHTPGHAGGAPSLLPSPAHTCRLCSWDICVVSEMLVWPTSLSASPQRPACPHLQVVFMRRLRGLGNAGVAHQLVRPARLQACRVQPPQQRQLVPAGPATKVKGVDDVAGVGPCMLERVALGARSEVQRAGDLFRHDEACGRRVHRAVNGSVPGHGFAITKPASGGCWVSLCVHAAAAVAAFGRQRWWQTQCCAGWCVCAVRQRTTHVAVRQRTMHVAVRQRTTHVAVRQRTMHVAVRQRTMHVAVRQRTMHVAASGKRRMHQVLVPKVRHAGRQRQLVCKKSEAFIRAVAVIRLMHLALHGRRTQGREEWEGSVGRTGWGQAQHSIT